MRDDKTTWNGKGALGYLRASKDEQEESVRGQLRIVGGEMARLGKEMIRPAFEDDGRRGSDEERPGLLALLDYCRKHPGNPRTAADFVPIFAQCVDRIGRFLQPMKLFTYLNEFRDLGYDVFCINEGITYVRSTIGEWIQFVVRSDQATGYSVRLSHDSMRGGIETAEKGFLAGGSPPYGYDRVVVGADGKPRCRYVNLPGKRVAKFAMDGTPMGTLEPLRKNGKVIAPTLDKSNADHVTRIPGDPIKVKAVRRIFELYHDGIGLRTVAATLNAEGFPTARGRKWVDSSVRSILTNPHYMGASVYGRRSKSKYHQFSIDQGQLTISKKDIFRKGFVHRELHDCIVEHDAHPALIEKKLWFKCQEVLRKKADGTAPKRSGRGARSRYLLTGLVKCDRCGYSYLGDTHRRTGWRSYQCGGYAQGGRSICQRHTIPAQKTEDWIVDEMAGRLLDGRAGLLKSREDFEKAIEREVAALASPDSPDDARRKMFESAVAEKRGKIDLILTGLSPDNLDVANEAIRGLKRDIATLDEELKRLKATEAPRIALNPKEVAREAASYLWNLKQVLDEGSIEERRKFIEYFVEGAKVNGIEGWVEVRFFENPALPVTFCMVPPTGNLLWGTRDRSKTQRFQYAYWDY